MVKKGTLSRVGKLPVDIPHGITVTLQGREIRVEGPHGTVSRTLPAAMSVSLKDARIVVSPEDQSRESKKIHGLTRTLISNMVKGAAEGFTKELIISGVGYRAEPKGRTLVVSLGYSHPINYAVPEGIDIAVEKGTKIVIKGADKELVGRVAAQVRGFRVPDVYKEKGIKYIGEVIHRKVGKAAATTQTGKA